MTLYIVSGIDMRDKVFVKAYSSRITAEKEHRSYGKIAKIMDAIDIVEFDRSKEGLIKAIEYGVKLATP